MNKLMMASFFPDDTVIFIFRVFFPFFKVSPESVNLFKVRKNFPQQL